MASSKKGPVPRCLVFGFPFADENSFESLDEEYINKRLAEVRLPEEDWMKIECDIKKLFTL